MIYTVTFNPALDYAVAAEKLKIGFTNRSQSEYILVGGKGLNVSMMLRKLGVESTALGFIGGFTGEEIKRRLKDCGVYTDLIEIDGLSRINVKIKSDTETEINASGPNIPDTALKELHRKISGLESSDMLVLSGSVPKNLPNTVYADIMKVTPKGVRVIVDAAGELLLNTLPYKPFMIKPNVHELSDIVGKELYDKREILLHARALLEKGAENVIVSMAGDGAVMVSSEGDFSLEAPSGRLVDSVGAGDSMVAGFIYGCVRNESCEICFKWGASCGSASAFSLGFADKEFVEKIYMSI